MVVATSSEEEQELETTIEIPQEPQERQALLESFVKDLSFWEMSPDGAGGDKDGTPSERSNGGSGTTIDTRGSSEAALWKSTVDPVTGRTYYYHSVTLHTQWEKPAALKAADRQRKELERQENIKFFREMEERIRESLKRGELIPGIPRDHHEVIDVGPPLDPMIGKPATIRMRTISGMDEHMMAELRAHESDQLIALQESMEQAPSSSNNTVTASQRRSPSSTISASSSNIPTSQDRQGRPPLPNRRLDAEENSSLLREDSDLGDDSNETESLRGVDLLEESPMRLATTGKAATDLAPSSTSPSSDDSPTFVASPLTHIRRNTGGTYFAHTTMDNPDIDASIKCVCGVYRQHILENTENNKVQPKRKSLAPHLVNLNLSIFHDNIDRAPVVPKLSNVERFYQEFFKRSQMELDTIIMSLIYVERLIKETNGVLAPNAENWRSILFACMILASKVWDDLSMWNADFSNVSAATGLSHFTLERINNLEIGILTSLRFSVKVSASEYAKYYFLIRNMLFRGGLLVDASQKKEKQASSEKSRTTSPSPEQKRRAQSFDLNAIRLGTVT